MALQTDARLQEVFSLALEDRSRGYQDLVSNSNAILFVMKERGGWRPFEGPSIRERLLYNETGSYTRYSGFEYLNPTPTELINDAEFTPKLAAVSVTLSGEELLKNSGRAQLENVMTIHMDAAEQELQDRFVEDLHGDGTLDGGRQIGGLQLAVPTTTNSGTYGGISRADNAIWRTTTYDIDTDFTGVTQFTANTAKGILDNVMIARSRGNRGPNVIAMSQQHYTAYTAALVAIQRVNDENRLGRLGFQALQYFGAGKRVDVVLEGGIGSAMPDNVTYFLDFGAGGGTGSSGTPALCFRYHPDRNFVPIGRQQTPINQDAIVRHIGFYGELTLNNPLHMAKLYDSDTAS